MAVVSFSRGILTLPSSNETLEDDDFVVADGANILASLSMREDFDSCICLRSKPSFIFFSIASMARSISDCDTWKSTPF